MDTATLQQLISEHEYDRALELVAQSSPEVQAELTSYIHQLRFTHLSPEAYTPDVLRSTLQEVKDDVWVAQACAAVVVDEVDVVAECVRIGLERTMGVKTVLEERLQSQETAQDWDGMVQLLQDEQRTLLQLRSVLLDRQHRLAVYIQLFGSTATEQEDDSIEIDDPWADVESTSSAEPVVVSTSTATRTPSIPLSTFLSAHIVQVAVLLAASGDSISLRQVYEQYRAQVFPYRYTILDAFPLHVTPQELDGVLPIIDPTTGEEKAPPTTSRRSVDAILEHHALSDPIDYPISAPLTLDHLSNWYLARIHRIETELIVDLALEWCQFAISHGAQQSQETARDLGFLMRLVYDTTEGGQGYSLDTWRGMDDYARVCAYVNGSSPATLAGDIRRLVVPYLESLDDEEEKRRLLQRYTLEAPLEKSLAVFEASKATLPVRQRIIDNDVDVARLALARLYGDDSVDKWDVKSRIFECLPVWDVAGDELDDETSREVTATTLESLASFMQPSATRAAPGPTDLLLFFEPLPFVALSRALDILDVHLESGEILAKWNVPAPLRTFLQTAFDREEQRRWAVRAARQAGRGFEDEDEWVSLMDDMMKLSGGGEGLLKGAFGLLGKEEVLKIFFGGVLSAGRKSITLSNFTANPLAEFDLAKRLLNGSELDVPLGPGVVESLVLDASREFYDNSSSGNMHTDGMKLAYDWYVPFTILYDNR